MPMLSHPLQLVDDPESDRIPELLPFVVDAHVHVFPDELFTAIRAWFDKFAWPIRYALNSEGVIDFLLSRGVGHVIALHYAHKPGIAVQLNRFMADFCAPRPHVSGTATVFPGEKDASKILEKAFSDGLCGVKLHAHVQYFDMSSPEMDEVYAVCAEHQEPLIMHVGREPTSPYAHYVVDPHVLCTAEKLERVLVSYPQLKVCVPHLGADEFEAYANMLNRYDNLWLDVAMAIANYLPDPQPVPLNQMRSDRILYGTDFPNIPYAWDRELQILCQAGLQPDALSRILGQNAMDLFSLHV